MDKFRKDEIAIIAKAILFPHFEGLECTILTKAFADEDGDIVHEIEIQGYGRTLHDGRKFTIGPEFLRKKKPPQELSTWEAVQKITGWNPTKQKVIHGNYTYRLDA